MEANVGPLCRGPVWMPITPKRGSFLHADSHDGEALVRALLAYKRGEPRVCAMVKAPTPEEEDRRRLCRERTVLIGERVQHVNRVKGLLFSQEISGYEPLRRDRAIAGSPEGAGLP